MVNRTSANSIVIEEIESRPENYTNAYLRRLIAEREYIRAALTNHGGSIILHGASLDLEGQDVYTSQIGNDFHLDLLEAEHIMVDDMSKQQRETLLEWAAGVDEKTATDLMRSKTRVIHMRRKRAIERLTEKMADELGGTGRTDAEGVRAAERPESTKDGDSRS